MKNHTYNEEIDTFDILAPYFSSGFKQAKSKGHHRIRVLKDETAGASDTPLDLSPLADDHDVFSLDIASDINLKKTDLSPLYACRSLTSLSLPHLAGALDYGRLHTLNTLYLTRSSDVIAPLSLPGVKDLLLTGLKNTNLSFLDAPGVTTLRISGGSISTLDGLDRLKQLDYLNIDHCSKLNDISAINGLAHLRRLAIEKCKGLTDFSLLARQESLEHVFISSLDSVAFVPAMKSLKAFKFWDLKDGNLNPLLAAAGLEQVDFFPQKKHYTHTRPEVEQCLKKRS